MKRFVSILIAFVFSATLIFTSTAFAAGSASSSISDYNEIHAGTSYKYKITVTITDSMDFIGTISFSGIFSHDTIYLDFHPSVNSSKTITNYVTFKPSSSQIGKTGTISVSGSGTYLDPEGNVKEYSLTKSRTAKVIAAAVSTPKPSVKTAVKTAAPSPTPGEWDAAYTEVAAMPEGGSITKDFTQNALVPASLLSSLKDKKGTFTANFTSYSCAIDGNSLTVVPASGSIDLSLKMDKDQTVSAAAGGLDVYQLHFADQQLPGPFTFSFKASSNKPGDTLYLYCYYGNSGIIEGVGSCAVDANGSAAFSIFHCSSYIVTNTPIPGTAGIDFKAQSESLAYALGLLGENTALKIEIISAQARASELAAQITGVSEIPQATDTLSVSTFALIAALCGAGALAALLTMLFGRLGPFKTRARYEDDELKY